MTTMTTMTPKTITITRRTRSLGYGVTSHVARDGRGIAEPDRQTVGLTPRALLANRDDEIRAVGGSTGGSGCYWREAFWIGSQRVVFSEYYCRQTFMWDLVCLAEGECDKITVTVAAGAE